MNQGDREDTGCG